MSLILTQKATWVVPEYGVAVWLDAIMTHEGCDVADIQGWALSHPESADLMSVCLVGPINPVSRKHTIGPELAAPWPNIGQKHTPLGAILAELLWAEARKTETRHRLQDAWEEARAEVANSRAATREDHRRDMRDDAA